MSCNNSGLTLLQAVDSDSTDDSIVLNRIVALKEDSKKG